MDRKQVKILVLTAMFLAIGLVLPQLTGQIKQVGKMLLPMHIPVLLCGLICGWLYGGAMGAVLPLLRWALFGMPPMPNAISMAFELAVYGAVVGLLCPPTERSGMLRLYGALLAAMIAGRAVWGVAQTVVLGIRGASFTWKMFMAGAFLDAIPGILLQLVLIPALMAALRRARLVPLR